MCIAQLFYSDICNNNNNNTITKNRKAPAIAAFWYMFNILNKMSLRDVTE